MSLYADIKKKLKQRKRNCQAKSLVGKRVSMSGFMPADFTPNREEFKGDKDDFLNHVKEAVETFVDDYGYYVQDNYHIRLVIEKDGTLELYVTEDVDTDLKLTSWIAHRSIKLPAEIVYSWNSHDVVNFNGEIIL